MKAGASHDIRRLISDLSRAESVEMVEARRLRGIRAALPPRRTIPSLRLVSNQ